MTEIASPSSFLAGADLVPPGQRDTKPRTGAASAVPFGSLVSEAAQNQARPARMQDEPPAPKTPSFEEETRATLRREAREAQEQPRERAGRAADDSARPQARSNRRADNRRDDEPAGARHADEAEGETRKERLSGAADRAEKHDDKACDMTEPADEAASEDASTVEGQGEATTQPVSAEAAAETAQATATAEGEIDPAALLVANAAVAPADGDAEGEGETGMIAPGVPRTGLIVSDVAAQGAQAVLAGGEKPKDSAPATTPAVADLPAPDAGASGSKGSADLIALMQAKTGDTVVKTAAPASNQPPAGEIAKANFADWINEFALVQGATHRSGDLVGSLDRALAAVPTAHAGQDALRPTPLQMLPIEIGMQAVRGVKTFQIRLDPAELGRVEVKLEFKEDGEVKASLVVDRVETLAMLKRDAPTLQQAFEQAGLRQSPDGLSFQLRGEQQGRDGQRENEGQGRGAWAEENEDAAAQRPAEFVMRRVMIPNSSLDLVI